MLRTFPMSPEILETSSGYTEIDATHQAPREPVDNALVTREANEQSDYIRNEIGRFQRIEPFLPH